MGTEEKKYPGACFDCGGEVTVSRKTAPDGVCANCGPVGIDVRNQGGEDVMGFSVGSWLDLQAHHADVVGKTFGLRS